MKRYTAAMTDKTPQEIIKEHYSKIGKKGGATNAKKGADYFRWVRLQRKDIQEQEEQKEEDDTR